MTLSDWVAQSYYRLVEQIYLRAGNALESEVLYTFGGIPRWQGAGLLGVTFKSELDKRRYAELGSFEQAYHKIRKAASQGQESVAFAPKELDWVDYYEILRLQNETWRRGTDCLIARFKLGYNKTATFIKS